jgi:hypothetical protein
MNESLGVVLASGFERPELATRSRTCVSSGAASETGTTVITWFVVPAFVWYAHGFPTEEASTHPAWQHGSDRVSLRLAATGWRWRSMSPTTGLCCSRFDDVPEIVCRAQNRWQYGKF